MKTKKIQQAILDLLLKAKAANNDLNSTFALSIDEGAGIVSFEDAGKDFTPYGYDERDTIAGVSIDMEDDSWLVVTSDSEGNINFLEPEDVDIPREDWENILVTLKDILAQQEVVSVEDAVNDKLKALSEALLKMRR